MDNTNLPQGQSFELLADLVLTAGTSVPTMTIEAYSGGLMFPEVNGRPVRAVVDLAGLAIDSQRKPVLKAHDVASEVGHTESIVNDGMTLRATGIVSGSGRAAAEVVDAAKKKFPWKASIRVDADVTQIIAKGQNVRVNGRTIEGPFILVSKSTLREISAVSLGGDDNTSFSIAAKAAGATPMDQIDPTAGAAQASAGAATASDSPQNVIPPAAVLDPPATLKATGGSDDVLDLRKLRAERAAEARRIASIESLQANYAGKECSGLVAQGIEEGWTVDATELKLLRASRPKAPAAVVSGSAGASGPDVLTAGLCMANGLGNIEKHFDAPTLDAAGKRFKNGRTASLQRVILEAAHGGGYVGSHFDSTHSGMVDILKAAFSTNALSGILSTTANKFLIDGYTNVDQSWRLISATRSVNDFKAITSYRMTDDAKFLKVAATGEIKHGVLGEQSYTNQVSTYARMFGISRQAIINDDLNALTSIPRALGRGAALALNTAFWTAFLADTSFFSDTVTDQGRTDGTTSTYDNLGTAALDSTGLDTLSTQFMRRTDPQGNILGATPRILLVPPELETTARVLMGAQSLVGGSSAVPNVNPWVGRYRVVVSPYLTDTNDWYLLADPQDIPAIEVAFLNGQQTPTIEQADLDFNILGIQFRGYFDFGVALQDPRAGVKAHV